MNTSEHDIACAYAEELEEFLGSAQESLLGYAYEWEGEHVVHVRTHAARHGYGSVARCLFVKGADTPDSTGAEWLCRVSRNAADGSLSVQCSRSASQAEADICLVPAQGDLYSRSKGLLEVGILARKRVLIIGLGSFGSHIAIELAKAGTGSFCLMDFDRVELHNLARHSCGINELGRLKTDALRDAILGKNPYAQVDRHPVNINHDPELLSEEVGKADLVICATDNNTSRFLISQALVQHGKVGIFGRAVTRAEGGDVFRYTPGGPCYCCMVGQGAFSGGEEEITDEASARRNGQIAAYVSAEDAAAMVQVGLSADIEPICNLMVKLALMELSRGADSGIAGLESELVFDYYIWANRRERRHANWGSLAEGGKKPTILRWYGARVEKKCGCPVCSTQQPELDMPDAEEEQLRRLAMLNEQL